MKRAVVVAAAMILALPAFGSAQLVTMSDPSPWGPRVRITPFVGQAPTVTRTEHLTINEGGTSASGDFDVRLGSGITSGLIVDVRALERFSFVASGAWVSRGRTVGNSIVNGDPEQHLGANYIMARAGMAMRLREPISELQRRQLSASVFAGPAYVREMPKNDPFLPGSAQRNASYWGANFGLNADIPLGWEALSLQAGDEDYVFWWNGEELGHRRDIMLATQGYNTTTFVEADASHMLLFRAGLSLRVR
jgi:hypothetical protein